MTSPAVEFLTRYLVLFGQDEIELHRLCKESHLTPRVFAQSIIEVVLVRSDDSTVSQGQDAIELVKRFVALRDEVALLVAAVKEWRERKSFSAIDQSRLENIASAARASLCTAD